MIYLPHGFKKTLPAKGEPGYAPDNEFYYGPGIKPQQKKELKTAGIAGGATASVPAYFYTKGLRRAGVPLRRVPQVLKRDIAALGTHQGVSGSLGGITSTIREGFTGTGGDIASTGRRVWSNVKGAWGGLRGLSARLDDIINFEEPKERKHPSLTKGGALLGTGVITGAGIATGSKATQAGMRYTGRHIEKIYKHLRGLR